MQRAGWAGCLSVLGRGVVRGFLANVGGGFILVGVGGGAGHWAIILDSLDTFLIFSNFLHGKSFDNCL